MSYTPAARHEIQHLLIYGAVSCQLIHSSLPIKQPHPVRFIVWIRGASHDEFSDMSNPEVLAAHLMAFEQMYSYEKRLQTFPEWPFREDCQCTPELMAKAGFVHCPSENEPDVACCFYCLKELEGWEPDDNPWTEHAKRAPNCVFLHLKKTFEEVTAIEFFQLEQERLRVYVKKMAHMKIANLRDKVDAIRKNLRALI